MHAEPQGGLERVAWHGLKATRMRSFTQGPAQKLLEMAKDEVVPYVNTWFWPSFTLVGTSSLFFGVYIAKITNSHEWKEIFLDYCHHKRTSYSPNPLDKVARSIMSLLRIVPK